MVFFLVFLLSDLKNMWRFIKSVFFSTFLHFKSYIVNLFTFFLSFLMVFICLSAASNTSPLRQFYLLTDDSFSFLCHKYHSCLHCFAISFSICRIISVLQAIKRKQHRLIQQSINLIFSPASRFLVIVMNVKTVNCLKFLKVHLNISYFTRQFRRTQSSKKLQ